MGGIETTTTTTTRVTRSTTVSNGGTTAVLSPDSIINLDQGDPAMFEEYWKKKGEECRVTIGGGDLMSYFSNPGSVCWFMMPELDCSVRRLHRLVGNAAVDGRHLVVGTGSTQLLQAVLYALCSDASEAPVSVVGAAPYYSCYPEVTNFLKSGLYRWEGDAHCFDKEGPYIELVTSPNNPDGSIRVPIVNRSSSDGKIVHDLAYYWPQYTPITHQADHDIMLFTFSKSTGHAGSRIGWAIVKDKEVARKMVKFIEVMSIGVSKEAQLRASTILGSICDGYEDLTSKDNTNNFFDYSKRLMADRWAKLREAAKLSNVFTLPKFSREYCLFSAAFSETYPAFAWMKCGEEMKDAESLLRGQKILSRGGTRFGCDPTYGRVSMLGREDAFQVFVERISAMKLGAAEIGSNGNHA